MSEPAITEAVVAEIISRWKFIHRVVSDNARRSTEDPADYAEPNEKRLVYELRFTDMRDRDAHLQLHARLEKAIAGVFPRPMPGVSLRFCGRRIRGLNWNHRHDDRFGGVNVGIVRGWHEKVWTNADQDKHIIDINGQVRNTDMLSLISFCCDRWNIEAPQQLRIGDI